jgi:hypothetical protein
MNPFRKEKEPVVIDPKQHRHTSGSAVAMPPAPIPENTLLAILLVCSSSRGSNIAFHWPPKPRMPVLLGRPRPPLPNDTKSGVTDVSWSASQGYNVPDMKLVYDILDDEGDDGSDVESNYEWEPPGSGKELSSSYGVLSSGDTKTDERSSSPSKERSDGGLDAYKKLLGFDVSLLAELLTPKRALCHQKFELVVDGLEFIGHPVGSDDGTWDWDELYTSPNPSGILTDDNRGRSLARGPSSPEEHDHNSPLSSERRDEESRAQSRHSNNLTSFHLVLVLERPDPSSSASFVLDKYLDGFYKQVAFKITAAMHYEQGRAQYVSNQVDSLLRLRESCSAQGTCFFFIIYKAKSHTVRDW